MTERVRRRSSKWDLKEDSQHFPVGTRENNAWISRSGESIQDEVSKSDWHSLKATGANDPKWSVPESRSALGSKSSSGLSPWEPLPGNRGEQKDEIVKSDYNDVLQSMKAWDDDQSYGMSMSPGLDGWREQNLSRSPRNGSGRLLHRSRSRSPVHGFRHEFEGENDRLRSGSGTSAPPCKDFAAGRCRRGGHCRFLHHDNRNYEGRRQSASVRGENWRSRHEKGEPFGHANSEEQAKYSQDKVSGVHEDQYEGNFEKPEGLRNISAERCNNFLKGKCFRGSSCKYVHDTDIADDHGARERPPYRRDRNTPFWHDYRRDPDRTHDTPCKYFAAGNCHHGVSCRFSHEGTAHDGVERRSRDERWGQKMEDEKRSWHGPKRTDNAADSVQGNVQGRSVEDLLGHNVDKLDSLWGGRKWGDQAVVSNANSPQLRNENSGGKLSDNAERRLWESSKWNDDGSDITKSSKWKTDYDGGRIASNVENASLGNKKWSQGEADSELRKSPHGRNGNDIRKIGGTVLESMRSSYDRWSIGSDGQSTTWGGPTWSDKPADQDVKKSSQFLSDNNGANISGIELRSHEKSVEAVNMPSAGTDREQYLHLMNNEGNAQTNQDTQSRSLIEINSPSHDRNKNQEVSGQQQHGSAVNMQTKIFEAAHVPQTSCPSGDAAMKPPNEISVSADTLPAVVSFSEQSFNSNVCNEIPQHLSSFIMNTPCKQVLPSPAPRGPGFDLNEQVDQMSQPSPSTQYQTSILGQTIKMPDMIGQKEVASRMPLTQNVVTSEQVAQITNLSASLAQIFGKGQQLPQLYATLNSIPSGLAPSHPNSAGPVVPAVASFSQSNEAVGSSKEYDPISDSIEVSKSDVNIQPPELLGNSMEQSKIADKEAPNPLKSVGLSSVTGVVGGGDPSNNGSMEATLHNQSEEIKQVEPVANDRAVEPTIKGSDAAHLDDIDADGQNDEEGKKRKDAKGIRMFKFALVETVKEILKPKWKEGQMSKEAHKTIVKKVVEKVTSTLQGAHVPQTQEKIDHYLSYSKPKLTKLVQAYVEKYLKT